MRKLILAIVLLLASGQFAYAQTEVSDAEAQAEYEAAVIAFMESLSPQTGDLDIVGIPAKLTIPEGLVYYPADDTKRVLEELWGNAPGYDQAGMLAPADARLDLVDTWGAIVSYEKTGYVSDDNARDIDYAELLFEMKKGTQVESKSNVEKGYPSMTLVGWAESPRYDAVNHRLYWAKELVFDGYTDDPTLNYDMRILGRRGVLSVNFVSSMSQFSAIEAVAPVVLSAPSFKEGEAYTDYQAGDKRAGYGIAALVAGGAGAAAIKKGGLIAVLLVFLKKGWVLIFAFGAMLWGGMKRMFRKS